MLPSASFTVSPPNTRLAGRYVRSVEMNFWKAAEVQLGGAKRRLAAEHLACNQPGILTYCFLHLLPLLLYPSCGENCLSTHLIELPAANMATFSVRAFIPPLKRRCFPLQSTRRYAVQAPGAPTLEIFSGQQKWMQKERAAKDVETSRSVDYLRDEVASRLCERVLVKLFCSFGKRTMANICRT